MTADKGGIGLTELAFYRPRIAFDMTGLTMTATQPSLVNRPLSVCRGRMRKNGSDAVNCQASKFLCQSVTEA